MKPVLEQTDQTLDAVLNGDKEAFRDLVKNHQRLVEVIVSRMIANEEDRRDLCQDIFIKVYEHLDQFQRTAKLSTWVAKVAINTCLHYLEKKRVPLYEDEVAGESTVDDCQTLALAPDEIAEDRLTAVKLSEEIDRLPVVWGTILTLYHLQEMTYAEISRLMSLPEGTVKSYLFRARQMLKQRLTMRYEREDLCA